MFNLLPAFFNLAFQKTRASDAVTLIAEHAFYSLEDVDSATMLNDTHREYAYYGCDDLTGFAICDNDRQDNVVTIEDRAFQYFENLAAVTIGTGTVEIGESVFSGCADALSVVVSGQSYANLARLLYVLRSHDRNQFKLCGRSHHGTEPTDKN